MRISLPFWSAALTEPASSPEEDCQPAQGNRLDAVTLGGCAVSDHDHKSHEDLKEMLGDISGQTATGIFSAVIAVAFASAGFALVTNGFIVTGILCPVAAAAFFGAAIHMALMVRKTEHSILARDQLLLLGLANATAAFDEAERECVTLRNEVAELYIDRLIAQGQAAGLLPETDGENSTVVNIDKFRGKH
jgi:hypothetical protein